MHNANLNIAISVTDPGLQPKALSLAKLLGLPLTEITHQAFDWLLVYTHQHLELRHSKNLFGQALFIDFASVQKKSRYRQDHIRQELLVKAVGIKSNYRPSICDLTAGLGRDAYLLYRCGCQVNLVERSGIIAALLRDGLQRADCSMPLFIGEAKDYLQQSAISTSNPIDVVYFDPIFPDKNNTALAKKESRILRFIVGEDEDANQIFALALNIAKKRVVVKRARLSASLNNQKPDCQFVGNSVRFDVYLCA